MDHRRATVTSILVMGALGVLGAFAWQQAEWTTPPAVTHALEGRDNCMMCHKAGVMEPVPDAPADHAERGNETCLWCHAGDAAVMTVAPPVIAHSLDGRDNCLMCHEAGKMEPVPDVPADHKGRENQHCKLCHTTA